MWMCNVRSWSWKQEQLPCSGKSVHFSSTTAVCNHSAAFSVHPRPLKVYLFQLCGTYPSSWTSKCVLHLSKCCKNMAPCECFSFTNFVSVPWECSAPCCAWSSQFFEVHELGYLWTTMHLRTSFVGSLHPVGHSGGRKFARRKPIFSGAVFLIFFGNMLHLW